MKIERTSSPYDAGAVEAVPEDFPHQKTADSYMHYKLYNYGSIIRSYYHNPEQIDTELIVQATLHSLKEETDLTDSDIDELEPRIREDLLPAALNELFSRLKNDCNIIFTDFDKLDLDKLDAFEPSGDFHYDSGILSLLFIVMSSDLDDEDSDLRFDLKDLVYPFIISVFKNTESILTQIKSKSDGPYRIPMTDFLTCLKFPVRCDMRKKYNRFCPAYDYLLPSFGPKAFSLISERLQMDAELVSSEPETISVTNPRSQVGIRLILGSFRDVFNAASTSSSTSTGATRTPTSRRITMTTAPGCSASRRR